MIKADYFPPRSASQSKIKGDCHPRIFIRKFRSSNGPGVTLKNWGFFVQGGETDVVIKQHQTLPSVKQKNQVKVTKTKKKAET